MRSLCINTSGHDGRSFVKVYGKFCVVCGDCYYCERKWSINITTENQPFAGSLEQSWVDFWITIIPKIWTLTPARHICFGKGWGPSSKIYRLLLMLDSDSFSDSTSNSTRRAHKNSKTALNFSSKYQFFLIFLSDTHRGQTRLMTHKELMQVCLLVRNIINCNVSEAYYNMSMVLHMIANL